MSHKKILFFELDQRVPEFNAMVEEMLPKGFSLKLWFDVPESERAAVLADTDYFLVLGQVIGKDMLQAAPRLRYIQRTGQGYDNVDIAAAKELGLPVSILPTGNAVAVAEHAILLPLALLRKLTKLDAETRAGMWPGGKYRTSSFEMDGKVHGFVGFGNIGRLAARRSKAFGTQIVYYDVVSAPEEVEKELGAKRLSLEELLAVSDIVSLHTPLLPSTRGMMGAAQFKLMKKSAILINTARGGLVDEEALCDALENGEIAGAGLDTFSHDPIPAGSRILGLDNVIATPHVAGGTIDTFRKQASGALDAIKSVEEGGKPCFVVNGVESARF